jgi:hypothetical protein
MNSRRFKLALMQSPRRRVAEKPRLIDPQAFFIFRTSSNLVGSSPGKLFTAS